MDDGRSFGEAREPTRFAGFDGLVETCRRTRAALVAVVHERSGDGDLVRAVIADDGLAHVDAVRAGLTALARTGQFEAAELRDLVRREGITERPRTGPGKRMRPLLMGSGLWQSRGDFLAHRPRPIGWFPKV